MRQESRARQMIWGDSLSLGLPPSTTGELREGLYQLWIDLGLVHAVVSIGLQSHLLGFSDTQRAFQECWFLCYCYVSAGSTSKCEALQWKYRRQSKCIPSCFWEEWMKALAEFGTSQLFRDFQGRWQRHVATTASAPFLAQQRHSTSSDLGHHFHSRSTQTCQYHWLWPAIPDINYKTTAFNECFGGLVEDQLWRRDWSRTNGP